MKIKTYYIAILFIFSLTGCFTNQDCVCPEVYSPVCGENKKTYSNSCLAECDDVNYVSGECPVYGIGTVKFSGDSICGYYISIFDVLYKPEEQFSGEFLVQDKVVSLQYRRLNLYYTCDAPYNHVQLIQILQIESLQ